MCIVLHSTSFRQTVLTGTGQGHGFTVYGWQRLVGFGDPTSSTRKLWKQHLDSWPGVLPAVTQGIRMWCGSVTGRSAEEITLKRSLSYFSSSLVGSLQKSSLLVTWTLGQLGASTQGRVSSWPCCPRLKPGPLLWDLKAWLRLLGFRLFPSSWLQSCLWFYWPEPSFPPLSPPIVLNGSLNIWQNKFPMT